MCNGMTIPEFVEATAAVGVRTLLERRDGKAYMVLTHESRTRTKRHYRLFVVTLENTIYDCTSMVCRALGKGWDEVRGTYNASGAYKSQDGYELSQAVSKVIGMECRFIWP